jgi:hypothetical protein
MLSLTQESGHMLPLYEILSMPQQRKLSPVLKITEHEF